MKTPVLVPDNKRTDAIFQTYGNMCVKFEQAVYNIMSMLAPDYTGGYWHYYTIDGAFLMALKPGTTFKVSNPHNYYDGELDSFDLSIAVNLMAISAISASRGASSEMLHTWEMLQKFYKTLPSRPELYKLLD